jgi:predicted  nucleic acid-binding Zn-ribbon protein
MLVWWIISLVVLIVCFIFAYRVIVSSYDYMPGDTKNFLSLRRNSSSESSSLNNETVWDLKNKLHQVEENSSFYEIQFTKLKQRLNALEDLYNSQQEKVLAHEEKEDWKEMYYQENEIKEKLENELDEVRQKLEETENKLKSITDDSSKWSGLQSDYDARLNDLQSMQNNIGLLQRKLEAAINREKELEQSLLAEINSKKQYSQLESENTRMKSENDELRRQIVDMGNKEKELEGGIFRLNQLESKLAVFEEEKAKMIADLEKMVQQNKIFTLPKNS